MCVQDQEEEGAGKGRNSLSSAAVNVSALSSLSSAWDICGEEDVDLASVSAGNGPLTKKRSSSSVLRSVESASSMDLGGTLALGGLPVASSSSCQLDLTATSASSSHTEVRATPLERLMCGFCQPLLFSGISQSAAF